MLEYGVSLLRETDQRSSREGVEWLRRCVEKTADSKENKDDEATAGTACYALGYAYEAGQGVTQSEASSKRWIAAAARRGNAQAKELLRRRRKDFRRRLGLDAMLLCCIVVFVCVGKTLVELCYVLYHRDTFKEEVSGADPSTPAYRWRDGDSRNSTREKTSSSAPGLC